ncbi:hypothetical protein GCM10022224_026490 [Nonomuraea antimicrobica]|uniref:CdiI immunity protein domain-containing protein n=1 Tax=Nonomuraea antimicrobica TaxID=561173 RepID=A0ABP7BK06_9ACTN
MDRLSEVSEDMRRYAEDDFGLTWLMSHFHADWTLVAETAISAVRYHLWEGLDPHHVMSLRRDASLLLEGLPSDSIEHLWQSGTESGHFFGRHVPSGSQWMEMLIEECDAWLVRRGTIPSRLDPYDQEAGAGEADSILRELNEAAGAIGAELANQLAQCLHRCTPNLSFRILLRVLSCKGEPISRSQYERFTRIGEALHYGEFVVSNVEYLATQ